MADASTRGAERPPSRSHIPPTMPKLAPADDPAWALTFALASLATEALAAREGRANG